MNGAFSLARPPRHRRESRATHWSTHRTLQNPTTPRVVIGEYQHFWTWRRDGDGARCNVLTAVYAVPGGFGFEEAFDKPLVIYSHNLRLTRV